MFDGGVALIDADSIYFQTCCVTKSKKDIRKAIEYTMTKIRRECMTDNMFVAIKGHGNFRQDLYPDYKKNRKELEPDMKKALTYAHQHMIDRYNAVMADGMEADDLVSIWAYECMANDTDYIIAGIDKDLLQIPGHHYNFRKDTHHHVSEDDANHSLMVQCLTGDGTDNIPGIKGIGPKKAIGILQGIPMERRWNRVKAAWRKHSAGNPELSRSLLRMLTSFEELDEIRSKITDKTAECKSDVLAGKES